MKDIQTSLFPERNTAEFVQAVKNLTQEIQELYTEDDIPWILGYSGGKDSTAVVQLVYQNYRRRSALKPFM